MITGMVASMLSIVSFASFATVPAILANRRLRLAAERERDFFAKLQMASALPRPVDKAELAVLGESCRVVVGTA